MIPTTPWDTVFSGLAAWLSIDGDAMDEVCPNLSSFTPSNYLISAEDMFTELPVSITLDPQQMLKGGALIPCASQKYA